MLSHQHHFKEHDGPRFSSEITSSPSLPLSPSCPADLHPPCRVPHRPLVLLTLDERLASPSLRDNSSRHVVHAV